MPRSVATELAPRPLPNVSDPECSRNILSPGTHLMTPQQRASVVFDMACIAYGAKNDVLAAACGVSGSLVSRWRNPAYPELPSLGQMFALGEDFLHLFKRMQERHFGWGRKALLHVVEALGDLADVLEGGR